MSTVLKEIKGNHKKIAMSSNEWMQSIDLVETYTYGNILYGIKK